MKLPEAALKKIPARIRSYLDEFRFVRRPEGIEAWYGDQFVGIWALGVWQKPPPERDPGRAGVRKKPVYVIQVYDPRGMRWMDLTRYTYPDALSGMPTFHTKKAALEGLQVLKTFGIHWRRGKYRIDERKNVLSRR